MSDSSSENLELSSQKQPLLKVLSGKLSSKQKILGRSKFSKSNATNDCLEEFEPLLPLGRGSFPPDNKVPDDEISSKIRQRTTKFSAAVDLETEKPSVNGVDRPVDLTNGERSIDSFLKNDFLLLDIKKGDTLQSIALQYHCTVADLKRANNIISNQQFYAFLQLRIPVKKHSLLTEKLPPATKITESSRCYLPPAENGFTVRTVNVGIGPISPGNSQEDAAAFFRKMDEDLVKIMQNTKSQKDSLEAATIALTSPSIQPLVKTKPHIGADCGIPWCYLVVVAILIGLILPVIAFIYMYTQHHNENSTALQHDTEFSTHAMYSVQGNMQNDS